MFSGKGLVLASASPRRRELLGRTGLSFVVDPSDADEDVNLDDPVEMVKELSLRKAMKGLDAHPDDIVLGADTVVALDGRIMGKPSDRAEALQMLGGLSGRTHEVCTGVTIAWKDDDGKTVNETFAERTEVEMYDNSPEMLEWYVSTGEPMDKAGAYGIQGFGTMLIKSIRGNYDNVVGLPVAELFRRLKHLGL